MSSELREMVHGMWAGVAPAWGSWADRIDQRASDLTRVLLQRASLHAGDRVLELAAGPGGAGLLAAEQVGSGGEVVITDVVPEMIEHAAKRAADRGLTNVATKVLDLEAIDEPDQSYDVVISRDGLMFAVEPERAIEEIVRVLRPGGRLAVAVWGPREANPWLGFMLDAVSEQVGMPVPPPGVPGPFALDDPSRLAALLRSGGLIDVRVDEVAAGLAAASVSDWLEWTTALAGPASRFIAGFADEAHQAFLARLQRDAAPYTAPDGSVDLPGLNLVASAHS